MNPRFDKSSKKTIFTFMIWFDKSYTLNFDTTVATYEKAFTSFITPQKNEQEETIPFEVTGELNAEKKSFSFLDVTQAAYLQSIDCIGTYTNSEDSLEIKLRYRKWNFPIILYVFITGLFIYLLPDYIIYSLIIFPIYLAQYLIFRIQVNLLHQGYVIKLNELISGKILNEYNDDLIN